MEEKKELIDSIMNRIKYDRQYGNFVKKYLLKNNTKKGGKGNMTKRKRKTKGKKRGGFRWKWLLGLLPLSTLQWLNTVNAGEVSTIC